jgi:hypothetical protein
MAPPASGYSGKRFIFEKAHELGVRAIVLDGPDSWAQILEKEVGWGGVGGGNCPENTTMVQRHSLKPRQPTPTWHAS